jgi:hypothetical protein
VKIWLPLSALLGWLLATGICTRLTSLQGSLILYSPSSQAPNEQLSQWTYPLDWFRRQMETPDFYASMAEHGLEEARLREAACALKPNFEEMDPTLLRISFPVREAGDGELLGEALVAELEKRRQREYQQAFEQLDQPAEIADAEEALAHSERRLLKSMLERRTGSERIIGLEYAEYSDKSQRAEQIESKREQLQRDLQEHCPYFVLISPPATYRNGPARVWTGVGALVGGLMGGILLLMESSRARIRTLQG